MTKNINFVVKTEKTENVMPYIFYIILCIISFTCCRGSGEDGSESYRMATEAVAEGKFIKAFQHADNAVNFFKARGDSAGYFKSSIFLSMLYHTTGQGEQAYAIVRKLDYNVNGRMSDFDINSNYFRLLAYYTAVIDSNYDMALRYNDSVIKLDKTCEPDNVAMLYSDINNRVTILLNKGDYGEAEALLSELLANPYSNDSIYFAHQCANRAMLFLKTGQNNSAVVYARKALEFEEPELQNIDNKLDAFRVILAVDSMQGNVYDYITTRNAYEQLVKKYQSHEVKYRILILQERNRSMAMIKEVQYRQRIMAIVLCLAVFVVVIVLVVARQKYRYNLAKRKIAELECEKLDVEAFRRKLECEFLKNKIDTQNKLLQQSEKNIIEISRKFVSSYEKEDDKNDRLKELEDRLYALHSDFILKIKEQYPGINDNDMLILGSIKLGWSTKEISAALNVSPQSIIKSRYRIRKKMNLDTSENLTDLIMSI